MRENRLRWFGHVKRMTMCNTQDFTPLFRHFIYTDGPAYVLFLLKRIFFQC